jgi:hypothetical protein
VLVSVANLTISSEAFAKKPGIDGSERGPKAWGRYKHAEENISPTLSGSPDGTVLESSFYEFAPDANDRNGDTLTFSIANKPAWADFDPTTGALYGTPSAADVGRYESIGIAVSDGQSSAELPAFAIDVTSVALGSVTLAWQPPTENTDGTTLTDLAGYRIYYGVDPQNLGSVIELTNSSVTSYVVDNLTPDTWYFAASAFNSDGVESVLSSPAVHDIL